MYLKVENIGIGSKVGIKIFDFNLQMERYEVREITSESDDYYFDEGVDVVIDKNTGKFELVSVFVGKHDKLLDEENVYDVTHPTVCEAIEVYELMTDLHYLAREIPKISHENLLNDNKEIQAKDLNYLRESIRGVRAFMN